MTHEEFIVEVAKRLGWAEEKTSGIVGTIIDVVSTELKMNNPVIIDHFGTLKTDIQSEYILVNPETKERHLMPPAVEIIFDVLSLENGEDSLPDAGFIPDEVLYNEVNSAFSQFEPTLLNEGVQFSGIFEIVDGGQEEETGIEIPELSHLEDEQILLSEDIFQSEPQLEPELEVEGPFMSDEPVEKELIPQIQSADVELSPPRYRSHRKMRHNKKIPSVWIPIAGGVAIVVAALFFFKGDGNR